MNKKIVIFGCQKIAVDIIEFLKKKQQISICLVVSYPILYDKIYGYPNLEEYCKKNGFSYLNSSPNNKLLKKIKKINPDLILSIYYRKIFNVNYTSYFKNKIINFHPSYLPFYKGCTPTAWCLLNNEKKTGVTIHFCNEKIDQGNILVQEKFKIPDKITGYELSNFCMNKLLKLFKKNFFNILSGSIKSFKQKKIKSYFKRIPPVASIDWNKNAKDIVNIIRVYSRPYSMTQFKVLNKIGFINKAKIINNIKIKNKRPGKILGLKKDKPIICCLDKAILIEEYYFQIGLKRKEIFNYFKIGSVIDSYKI